MFSNVVGIAEMKISDKGTLVTYGLGSCIGAVVYDERTKLSGLIHIMLPSSDYFSVVENPFKFADSGIPLMVEELIKKGADRKTLKAKIAGGAAMYFNNKDKINFFNIGNLNIDETLNIFKKLEIDIVSHDLGGVYARTIEFDISKSTLNVKRMHNEKIEIIQL